MLLRSSVNQLPVTDYVIQYGGSLYYLLKYLTTTMHQQKSHKIIIKKKWKSSRSDQEALLNFLVWAFDLRMEYFSVPLYKFRGHGVLLIFFFFFVICNRFYVCAGSITDISAKNRIGMPSSNLGLVYCVHSLGKNKFVSTPPTNLWTN